MIDHSILFAFLYQARTVTTGLSNSVLKEEKWLRKTLR